jgi:hypothetical protein
LLSERTLAVIDGNSLLHRAFHALPVTMTAPDGRPTNAAYGFVSMLLKLTESFRPDSLIVAFDKGRPKFRSEVLERYKIHRPPTPEELRPQFGIVKDLLAAMNVPVSVMETAGEGGAWGIALLAAYMLHKVENEPLEAYLSTRVFAGENGTTIAPDPRDVEGFAAFMERYKRGLVIERAAVDGLK